MTNESRNIWAVFNGEIYNYLELRGRLIGLGHQFSSETDSETIIHAYEQWGIDCFNMFSGMFAIGIWDAANQRMILARDPHGKKPLYYSVIRNHHLLFASTLRPLAAWPAFERAVDQRCCTLYHPWVCPLPSVDVPRHAQIAARTFRRV